VVDFFREFFRPNKIWALQEFMQSLDVIYELIRVRFTKGGHKTN